MLKTARGFQHGFQAVRHPQGSDVADYEFICDAQFAAQLRV